MRRMQPPPASSDDQTNAATPVGVAKGQPVATAAPRVLYIDAEDDLPALLDRVEEHGSPAIVVLPESARAVRGGVAARLLKRRADAAGIPLVVVSTDRALGAALRAAGVACVSTVGDARGALTGAAVADPSDPLLDLDWDAEDGDAPEQDGDADTARQGAATNGLAAALAPDIPILPADDPDLEDEDEPAPAAPVVVSRPATPRPLPRSRVRRWAIGVAAAALLVLIGLGAWVVFFPAATLHITYTLGTIDRTYVVGVGDLPGEIPMHRTHLTDSAAVTVPGTGVQLVPDGHATGTITLANPLNGVVHVPAGTIVDAQNGSRFVTTQPIDVPSASHSFSGTANGQASVPVQAVQGGTAGNVPQGSIVSIEGRLAGAMLVTNLQAFGGGTMRTVYRLTPADIQAPEAALRERLAASESATLQARYARAVARVLGAPQLISQTVTQYLIGGRPYARIRVAVRIDMSYIHQEDLQALASARLRAELAGRNRRVVAGTEIVDGALGGRGVVAQVRMRVRAVTSPSIDVANLRALLVGQSVADARALLDGSARNGGWTYTLHLNPPLGGRMPQAPGLITINVRQTGA